jgi:hypothetical protein
VLVVLQTQVVAVEVGMTSSRQLLAVLAVLALSSSAHQERLLQPQAPQQSQLAVAIPFTNSTLLVQSLSKEQKWHTLHK